MGWKCGCQPFRCPCWQNVTQCRKEICSTYLFKASIPATPFRNFNHPLPTRSLRFLRAAVPSASSALCLHHAHPLVAAAGKSLSHAEKRRVWSWICGLQDLLQCSDCALSCQPFSCPCSQNVTHCRKEVCSTCLSKESMPFNLSLPCQKLGFPRATVRSASYTLRYGCIMPIPSLQLQKTVEKASLMQRSRGFGHGVAVSRTC